MDVGVAPREEAFCASVAELLAPPDGVLALSAGRCSRIAIHGAVKTCARCRKAVPSQQTSARNAFRNAAPPVTPRSSVCCCAAHLHLPNMATRSTMLRLLCALVLCAASPDGTARPPPR